MSSPIRPDLVVPYRHSPAKPRNEAASGMISQTLPMAAMFMRNKILSWSSLFLAIQSYLSEPINKPQGQAADALPPLLRVAFALISMATCYLEFFFPGTSPNLRRGAQAVAEAAAETN